MSDLDDIFEEEAARRREEAERDYQDPQKRLQRAAKVADEIRRGIRDEDGNYIIPEGEGAGCADISYGDEDDDPHEACDGCGDEHPVGVLDGGKCPSCVDDEDLSDQFGERDARDEG